MDVTEKDLKWLRSVALEVVIKWSWVGIEVDELLWPGYLAMGKARSRLRAGYSKTGAYVRKCVWGVMMDYAEKSAKEETRAGVRLDIGGLVDVIGVSSDGTPERVADESAFEKLIVVLPSRLKRVVRRRIVEGWTFGEIGRAEGVSDGMALLMYQGALKEIRIRLGLEEVE